MLFKLSYPMVSLLLATLAVIGQVSYALDVSSLQERLTQFAVDDEVGFEADSLIFLDQSHHFTKTKRSKASIATMRVANLHASAANVKHAIRAGVFGAAQTILDDYASTASDKQEDLNEASAVLARVLVRAKVTILNATESLWKRMYKLIEGHRDAGGMGELLEEIMVRLEGDPISLQAELEFQRDALSKFKFSDTLSESNFLQWVDQIIDDAFGCAECGELAQEEMDPLWQGAAPLATSDMVDGWLVKHLDEHYLEKVARSTKHVEELADSGDTQPTESEWQSVKLEELEAMLGELFNKQP